MRILHLINHTGRFNGNVHAAVDLACAQAALGHTVSMCSIGGDFDDVLTRSGVEILILDQTRKPLTIAKAILKFTAIVGRWRPDVVHAHMVTSAIIAWPATRLHRIRLITTVHNAFEKSAVLMALGDRVIAVSAVVRDTMQKRGVPKSRLRVVLNGTVGSARRTLPAPDPIPLSHPAFVYVGGIHPRKGLFDLIEAMKRVHAVVPEAHLYLAGEGPNEEEYKLQADGCDYIHFVGSHPDPRGYLLGADVFVLASHHDPAPLVISEAREAGCAVVATNVDGIPQLLDDGRAGALVNAHDAEGLAAAMIEVVSSPEKLKAARAAALTGLDAFSISRVAKEALAVYVD